MDHGVPPPVPAGSDAEPPVTVSFTHHGTSHSFEFAPSSTINDLSLRIESELHISAPQQKFMLKPKLEILKPPFDTPNATPLRNIASRSITLLAPTAADLASVSRPASKPQPSIQPVTAYRTRDWKKAQDEATYTFHSLVPLPYLPNPERSTAFLARLRDDPGIKATMRKHQFSVGTLTEMNPADHTTHDGKTLGLNRNKGEVIELRLRTDSYDGYRDYKVIRDTLCHELAHNVWGDHDRNFWNLCHEIEGEVRRNDWKHGGHAVSNEVFYDPEERARSGAHVDGGGWQGGDYVLGSERGPVGREDTKGLSRRELAARAAEERLKKQSHQEDRRETDS